MVTGTVSCLQGDYLRKQVVKALSGLIVGGTMLAFDMHLFFRKEALYLCRRCHIHTFMQMQLSNDFFLSHLFLSGADLNMFIMVGIFSTRKSILLPSGSQINK